MVLILQSNFLKWALLTQFKCQCSASVKHIQENPVVSPALLITIEMSSHWHLCARVCVCRGRHRFTNKFTVFRHYKDIFFMVTNIRAVVCITTNRHWLLSTHVILQWRWRFCHIIDNASVWGKIHSLCHWWIFQTRQSQTETQKVIWFCQPCVSPNLTCMFLDCGKRSRGRKSTLRGPDLPRTSTEASCWI